MQTPIRQKRPNFRIPYFCPSKSRPLHSAVQGGCPLRAPPSSRRHCPLILSAFPGDRLSSVLVNSDAKNISTFITVSPPPRMFSPGRSSHPWRYCLPAVHSSMHVNTFFAGLCSLSGCLLFSVDDVVGAFLFGCRRRCCRLLSARR